jgi:hypothetical protein
MAELFGKELVDFLLHVAGLTADQRHGADRIARSRHLQIGLVLVVPDAYRAEVVFVVGPALADRDGVIDL